MICDELVTKIAKNVQTYSLHCASLPILANHLTNLRRDGKIRAKSIQQWNRLRYDTATTRRNEIGMKHTVEVMISEQEVQDRVRQLGKEITEFYNGSEDLVLVDEQPVAPRDGVAAHLPGSAGGVGDATHVHPPRAHHRLAAVHRHGLLRRGLVRSLRRVHVRLP